MVDTTLRQAPDRIKCRTLILASPALPFTRRTFAPAMPKIEAIRPWVRYGVAR